MQNLMELSEMTTDRDIPMVSTAAHELFLPGCFVVLQGIAGDGLANTIETLPEYSRPEEGDDEEPENAEIPGEVPTLEEDHFHPSNQLQHEQASEARTSQEAHRERSDVAVIEEAPSEFSQSSAQQQQEQSAPLVTLISSMAGGGLLWRTMTSSAQPTCVLNNPQQVHTIVRRAANQQTSPDRSSTPPPNQPEEFVVISSEPNTPTRIQLYARPADFVGTRSKRKEQAIQEWADECWQRQRRQRKEWRLQQQQQQLQQQQQSRQHQPQEGVMEGNPNSPAPYSRQSSSSLQAEDDWWLDPVTGYIAIFEEVPQLSKHSSVITGRRMGHLPPGSTVVATKLYTLESETLHIIRVDAGSEDDQAQPPLTPCIGCIQVLELQLNSQSLSIKDDDDKAEDDDDLQIDRIGYCVYSVHGYAFLVPGIPTMYMDPKTWWWRVTCRVGAFLRQGLELSSDHQCTIPFGNFVQVTRRTVNRMGLSRLRVVAQYDGRTVEGWCSEFLNPLSGQRGHVVQPLPFPVPAIYRVSLEEGAVIREQVELSSRQIGQAPYGTLLTIVQRQFSEHPQEKCVERLKLAGKYGGWISVRLNQLPPHDKCVVELVGVDPKFDPNRPGDFHWDVLAEEDARMQAEGVVPRRTNSTDDISSVDDGSGGSNSDSNGKPKTGGPSSGADKEHHKRKARHTESCLICLTEEMNATIVHGETGHIACCLTCARVLKARGDRCPVCRLPIDSIIQHFWA